MGLCEASTQMSIITVGSARQTYQVGLKTEPFLIVYNSCNWWCSKVLHISNSSVLQQERNWYF